MLQIFIEMQETVKLYEDIFKPVEEKLKAVLQDIDEQVTFTSDIVTINNLGDEILNYINQRVSGDFQGIAKGISYISEIIRATDFKNSDSVRLFINEILESTTLNINMLNSLLQKRLEFNNYIIGLSYLIVDYT